MASAWHVIPFLLLAPALAMPFDCDGATVNGHTFVANSLEGNWQVHYREDRGASIHNTTYTINLCKPLQHDDNLSQDQQCHIGARVCAQKYVYNKESEVLTLDEVIDVAGQYTDNNRHMDSKIEWLGTHDQEQEGYRLTLNGGRSPFEGSKGKKQRAVIDFICDKDLTGLEGLKEDKLRRRDDEEEKPPLLDLDKDKSLQYTNFLIGEDVDTLKLSWKTKLACANATTIDPETPKKSGGWGFFTWFVIIVFLLAAAYIIFGSWLNYNRYGARGWDLIPHGDTIRDLPYIIKEFASNLMSRIRGDGSRGGYSAV